jgi:type II secretory pathway component GspD/PulD (secretin)
MDGRRLGSALRAARALCTALLLAAADSGAQGGAQVYRCQFRVAEELLPLAQTALAGRGEAVVDPGTNSIVLVGPPAAVADAEALLAQQDRRPRTIVVHYESRTLRELEAAGVRIAWRAGSGSASIGTATFPPGKTGVDATVVGRAASGASQLAGTLRIVEGQSGRITTGRSVPITTRRGWTTSTEYVTAESGFDASGRVLGDGRVQLDLAPLLSRFRPDGAIELSGGSSSLVLTPGDTVVLGGVSQARSESERSLDGIASARSQDDTVMLLRADVE